MTHFACIGECMVELREDVDGRFVRSFGGDTLNTAIYLARLGMKVDYATALGDDPWSQEMADAWAEEGVGTSLVIRCQGAMPGLYVIQTDQNGERRFIYWRDSAAARRLFALPETDMLASAFRDRQILYYSGISLSLYGPDGRARLSEILAAARANGTQVAFDTNFRLRGWPERAEARAAYEVAMTGADIVFASSEDLEMLYGAEWRDILPKQIADAECILKLPDLSAQIHLPDGTEHLVLTKPAAKVVDTTAAGDSFAAAYMAARATGASPVEAAAAAHRLAGLVVRHPGAIIPTTAMAELTE